MTKLLSLLVFILSLSISTISAQEEKIHIDSLQLENTYLLFEAYQATGKHCENKNGLPKYCTREIRLFDNNIEELSFMYTQALSLLNFKYEIVSPAQVDKEIYEDKELYRYFFKYKAEVSKKGSSCFSNPGALLIRFYAYDRITEKTHELDLDYAFFICDIDLLVAKLNETLKEPKKK